VSTTGYLSGALRGVFGDRTWWRKTIVIAVLGLVPLVGWFLIFGYYMVLMRETAWGSDRLSGFADMREILRRGLDGFLVSLVWALVLVVPLFIIVAIGLFLLAPGNAFASDSAAYSGQMLWIMTTVMILVNVLLDVAILRVALYREVSAGLRLSGIRDLIRRCPSGFWKVTGLMVLWTVVNTLLGSLEAYPAQWMNLSQGAAFAVNLATSFVISALCTPLALVVHFAYGLWGRDTDPASWPPLVKPTQPVASHEPDLWRDEDAVTDTWDAG